jgi:hypothetical protein
MWQDIVILAGSIVAIASLVPTLLDEDASVPLSTSVPTLVVLSGQGVAFYTLGLLGSAVGAIAGFAIWSLIAYYKAPRTRSRTPTERSRPAANRTRRPNRFPTRLPSRSRRVVGAASRTPIKRYFRPFGDFPTTRPSSFLRRPKLTVLRS